MAETFPYWLDRTEFQRQSALLGALLTAQATGYETGESEVSLEKLTEQQLDQRIGCLYLSGSRIDNALCLGSRSVAILHAAYPTDYPKAIAPSFHYDHDELMACTCGSIVIEYASSLDEDAEVQQKQLAEGDWLLLQRGWPHRVSLAPLRALERPVTADALTRVRAGYVAMKMGRLAGKNTLESMSTWSDRRHPLIERWKDDVGFLQNLAEEEKLNLRIAP